jgi:hypothetical protein
MRPALALVPAAIPVVALVGGLPFANRLEPRLFGMPFLLTWILAWVALTPAFLGVAYLIHRRTAGDATGTPR